MANASVSKFQRVLNALPDNVRAPIRAEVWRQAEGLRAAMSTAVARGETGNLQKSIRTEQGRNPMRVLVRAGGALTTRSGAGDQGFVREFARAVRGKDANYDYALAQEFGTQHIPAQPFFWPTYRARKRRIRRAIKDSAKAAINSMVPLK